LSVAKKSVSEPSFVHLDMARGAAALAVLIGHLRSFVFPPYGMVIHRTPLDTLVWAISGFGHQAVMVFFVLSGFFITRSVVVDGRKEKGFSWPIYLIKRTTRLWIVLIPSLFLTLMWDSIGVHWATTSFYSGALYEGYSSGPSLLTGGTNLEPATFLGNLFFLQTIFFPIFGTNGPLWSLANEFWYYILFPMIYVVFFKRSGLIAIIANLVLLVSIASTLGMGILLYGSVWLLGSAAYTVYERGWLRTLTQTMWFGFASFGMLALSLAVSKAAPGSDFQKDFLIGLATTFVVLSIAGRNTTSQIYESVAHVAAECSYTTYLVHFPFLAVLVTLVLHNEKFQPTWLGYGVFALTGIVALAYSYAIYWLFERRTGAVRRLVLNKYQQWKFVARNVRSNNAPKV
jgi:peptidoglycan/LPS O-acetylase OafA/YrhL